MGIASRRLRALLRAVGCARMGETGEASFSGSTAETQIGGFIHDDAPFFTRTFRADIALFTARIAAALVAARAAARRPH